MELKWNPMRWPKGWNDPSALALLKGTCINYLLIEEGAGLESVTAQARENGIQVDAAPAAPNGVIIVQGEWPGLKMSPSGAKDVVSAGPTGAPCVDPNGWKIRLESALRPGLAIWVDAVPKEPNLWPESYVIGVADSATYAGRRIVSLDEKLAAGIASQRTGALETWKRLIVKAQVSAASFAGLRAVIHADGNPPSPMRCVVSRHRATEPIRSQRLWLEAIHGALPCFTVLALVGDFGGATRPRGGTVGSRACRWDRWRKRGTAGLLAVEGHKRDV